LILARPPRFAELGWTRAVSSPGAGWQHTNAGFYPHRHDPVYVNRHGDGDTD